VRYSEPPAQLVVGFKGNLADAGAWYQHALEKLQWTPTTDSPAKHGPDASMIYRHPDNAMLEITFREVDASTRLTLKYTRPDELAESERPLQKNNREPEEAADLQNAEDGAPSG
jgi:hypothetical protein